MNSMNRRTSLVVVVAMLAWSLPLAAQTVTPPPPHGMFNAAGEVIGNMTTLRCDELPKFDAAFGSSASYVLGAFGNGVVMGHITGVILWLESDPSTPLEQETAKVLREKYANAVLSIGVVDATVRARCSVDKDAVITGTLRQLVFQIEK